MRQRRWTAADVPDQRGRVALVTGANGGIGAAVAAELARRGARVLLGCRDVDRGAAALRQLLTDHPRAQLEVVQLDLVDPASIEAAAEHVRSAHGQLHLLVANAAVCMPPPARTPRGDELQLATNHLGHVELVERLLATLVATPSARIVSVTSMVAALARLDVARLDELHRWPRLRDYARSKAAIATFALELDRRLVAAGPSTRSIVAHPGSATTGIARHIPRTDRLLSPLRPVLQQSAAMGALPVLRAATDPTLVGGETVAPSGPLQWRGHPVVVAPLGRTADRELGAALWRTTEQRIGRRVRVPAGGTTA